jgi:hypothetical protein
MEMKPTTERKTRVSNGNHANFTSCLRRGLSSYATAKLAISSNQHFSLTLVALLCNNPMVCPATWNIAPTCSIASFYAVAIAASYGGCFMQMNRCVRIAHAFFSDQDIFYGALRLSTHFIALSTCQNSRVDKIYKV